MSNKELPSIWRTELWHPLSVHFPIAVLLLATIVGLLACFVKKEEAKKFLRNSRLSLLLLGTMVIWPTVYTGSLAYNVAVREICDPGLLGDHEWWGYVTAIAYTLAAVLDILLFLRLLLKSKITSILMLLLLSTGAAALSYTGHLGAKAVYQQSAGVYQPSEDCIEFNE